ncbi:uncharacterized protein LOC143861976 isoform X2 [Tasmannia lanceolata]|uniref:uncharacterized protein LOC143861976 isoform X2 n=1 Tax=Tasmannia lanceolata TaxID=3420 RepID=UPI00406371EE
MEGGNGMDCIKEDALILKGIAEQMIRTRDYYGARDKLNDAKQLFPVLENVSQMLTVCNVLCAADFDSPSHGMDWYFILQLNPDDDEATITSRYQKLCLDLEPIKDEFPGAKYALEFIDKAMSVLLDKAKRSEFDAMIYEPITIIKDPSHVLAQDEVELLEDLSYVEGPICIDRKEHVLRSKVNPLVKVLWHHHGVEKAIWKREDEFKKKYPELFALDNPPIVKKIVKEGANPVTLKNDSSLEEKEREGEKEQEKEPFSPTRKRGRPAKIRSTVSPSKKQQTEGVHCKTQKFDVAMIREATEEAMNEFSILASHHTEAPSPLPSENLPQDSLQPSLPTLHTESGYHSPNDSPNHSPSYSFSYSPSPSPSLEHPATPLEMLPSLTIIDYIADLRQLILDESASSPEPRSSSSIVLESTEIQNAKKIVVIASSMELELFLSKEFQLELKNAIDILLANENRTPGRTFKLLNFKKYIECLVPDYYSYQEDLDAADRVSSEANFLRQTLSQTVNQMERLADVNKKWEQEKESILEEKSNLKAMIKELSQQLTKTEASLYDNHLLMKEQMAKTEEDKMSFKTKMTEKKGLKIKEEDAKKYLEHLRGVWMDKRKLIRNIGSKSMEGR